MKILVHTDSAFNSLYFSRWLKEQKWEAIGYFYNPNIQPYSEYQRCLLMQKLLGVLEDFIMVYPPEYDFEEYLKNVAGCATQAQRCENCFIFVLEQVAQYAKRLQASYFTTSWLLNPKHDHELIKKIGSSIAEKYGLKFLYQDFSKEWEASAKLAKKMNLYDQPYCGCVYSEKHRFYSGTLAEKGKKVVLAKAVEKKAVKKVKKAKK